MCFAKSKIYKCQQNNGKSIELKEEGCASGGDTQLDLGQLLFQLATLLQVAAHCL